MANARRIAAASLRAGAVGAAALVAVHGAPAVAAPLIQHRADEVELRLLAFSGLQGAFDPPADGGGIITQADGSTVEAGGAAYLAAYLAQLRQQSAHSLLLSAGGNIGTRPNPAAVLQDEPVMELLNSWGVAASAIGSDELAVGRDELTRLQAGGCHPATGCAFRPEFPGAKFPMLAANVTDDANKPVTLPFTISHVANVPVGVIGVTSEAEADGIPAGATSGLRFNDEIDAINRTADVLQFFGVDAIVVLLQTPDSSAGEAGPNDCATTEGRAHQIATDASSRVDIIFAAGAGNGSSCTVRDPAGNERPLIQSASVGRTVSVVDVVIDPANGDILRDRTSAFNQVVTRDIPVDVKTQELVDETLRRAQEFSQQHLGELSDTATRETTPSGESTLGHLVADAQLAATAADGAQAAFVASSQLAADLPAGPVTYGNALAVHPGNQYLYNLTLTGQQLYGLLEEQFRDGNQVVLQPSSNLTYRIDAAREPGMRIADLRIGDELVDKNAEYRVTADAFLTAGGDNFPTLDGASASQSNSTDVQALVSYLLAKSPLAPPSADRISRAG